MQNLNPTTVWTVPESFRTIYTHAREVPVGVKQLYVSGQFGVSPNGIMRPDFPAQLAQAIDNVEALLAAAGMDKVDQAKTAFFLTARTTCKRGERRGDGGGPQPSPLL